MRYRMVAATLALFSTTALAEIQILRPPPPQVTELPIGTQGKAIKTVVACPTEAALGAVQMWLNQPEDKRPEDIITRYRCGRITEGDAVTIMKRNNVGWECLAGVSGCAWALGENVQADSGGENVQADSGVERTESQKT